MLPGVSSLHCQRYPVHLQTERHGAWMTLPRRVALWRALCYESW